MPINKVLIYKEEKILDNLPKFWYNFLQKEIQMEKDIHFATMFKSLLKELHYSQAKFGRELKIDKNTVNLWCQGKTLPTLPQLKKIIKFSYDHSSTLNPIDLIMNDNKNHNYLESSQKLVYEKKISSLLQNIKELETVNDYYKYQTQVIKNELLSKFNKQIYDLREKHKTEIKKIEWEHSTIKMDSNFYNQVYYQIKTVMSELMTKDTVNQFTNVSSDKDLITLKDEFIESISLKVAKEMKESPHKFLNEKPKV